MKKIIQKLIVIHLTQLIFFYKNKVNIRLNSINICISKNALNRPIHFLNYHFKILQVTKRVNLKYFKFRVHIYYLVLPDGIHILFV